MYISHITASILYGALGRRIWCTLCGQNLMEGSVGGYTDVPNQMTNVSLLISAFIRHRPTYSCPEELARIFLAFGTSSSSGGPLDGYEWKARKLRGT